MKIVVLYSNIVSYTEGVLSYLASIDEVSFIEVVYWDNSKHILTQNPKIQYHPRSSFSNDSINKLLIDSNPSIILVSGWMDKGYVFCIQKYKKINKEVKVVCGIDDQWKNTFRQRMGKIIFRFWFKKIFDFMWVAGKPQYHYAKMMGYKNNNIISNLYSSNYLFYSKKVEVTRRIVFLGRFSIEKGIINLLDAYKKLPIDVQLSWPLVLIGDGPMKNEIVNNLPNNAIIIPFLQNNELLEELDKGGVLCLPSNLYEMWGVVIHEAAILGYPLLISNICGAISEFLIDGYNGYSFDPNKTDDLFQKLIKITSLSEFELKTFSERSHILGSRINTEISAYSLLSVLQ